ncbi:MAG TPA: 30S ribosomal protein S20 [Patescibacteria group bacterium]|nr:30S ribosomal protein S20 [Patescibacteria group bacterium]
MPVTKTAKRALRSSRKKGLVNKAIIGTLEVSIRKALKAKSPESVAKAVSFADRAAKKRAIHKNRASRIKARLAKLLVKGSVKSPAKSSKRK